MTKEEILKDIAAVTKKLSLLKSEKEHAAISGLTSRLKATADQLQHDQRSSAYVQFKESEAYILELMTEVESSGLTATDPQGNQHAVKWIDADRTTARTFGTFKAGATVSVNGYSYIVSDFNHSYAGSTVTLLALSSKALIDGEPVTPYSGRPCRFNNSDKTLILSNSNRLSPGQAVIIDGAKYFPTHLVGNQAHFVKYQLTEATP